MDSSPVRRLARTIPDRARLISAARRAGGGALATLALSLSAIGAAAQDTPPPASGLASGTKPYSQFRAQIDGLSEPASVAVGPDAAIYVAETGRHRVVVYDPNGRQQAAWDGSGDAGGSGADGPFCRPQGLAVAPDGAVFVADSGNHRIVVLTPRGDPQHTWGSYGPGAGQFNRPTGLAATADRLIVADTLNDRVQVFDRGGGARMCIGRFGHGPGEFDRPLDVAADADGALYVADSGNHRIQKFDAQGRFVAAWGEWGSQTAMFAEPTGVACHGGAIYVADSRNHRIQAFSRDGGPLCEWGVHAVQPREGQGRIHYPADVAFAPSGAFAVVCETFENRCQLFVTPNADTPPGTLQDRWYLSGVVEHYGRRFDTAADLLPIVEPDSHSISLFRIPDAAVGAVSRPRPDAAVGAVSRPRPDAPAEDGRGLETAPTMPTDFRSDGRDAGGPPVRVAGIGGAGRKFGEFSSPGDVELDWPRRRLYAVDCGNRRLQVFGLRHEPASELKMDPTLARFVRSYDLTRLSAQIELSPRQWVIDPAAIKLAPTGDLFMLDARNNAVFVFDGQMRFLRAFGGYGRDAGQFRGPSDLAFAPAGDVLYVVDADNRRVQALDPAGRSLGAWSRSGDGDADFVRPYGIAVDRDGFVYVTDSGAHCVAKFDRGGGFVKRWGGQGLAAGEFYKPGCIAQDSRGRLIVIDFGNHRGQFFDTDGNFLSAFGARLFVRPTRGGEPGSPTQK